MKRKRRVETPELKLVDERNFEISCVIEIGDDRFNIKVNYPVFDRNIGGLVEILKEKEKWDKCFLNFTVEKIHLFKDYKGDCGLTIRGELLTDKGYYLADFYTEKSFFKGRYPKEDYRRILKIIEDCQISLNPDVKINASVV